MTNREGQSDTLGAIIQALGPDGALQFIELFGGTRFYIPAKVAPGSRLAVALGIEAAKSVCSALAVGEIKVPVARPWRIRIMREQGKTYRQIAKALGVTENTVAANLANMGLTGDGAPAALRRAAQFRGLRGGAQGGQQRRRHRASTDLSEDATP